MAVAAAAIAAAATVAGTAAGAVSASQKAKAAKKGTKVTQSPPAMTPMGEAIQGTMLRLLLGRLQEPPQSFGDYMTQGPQAALKPGNLSFSDRIMYGLGDPESPGARVQPSNVNPDIIAALQKLGLSPSGGPEIRQGEFTTATPTSDRIASGPYTPEPQR